ncbi:MAG: AmmeMemoRadiSam system protein A [Firmicutes bacterium]|jgi:AmmeMemoRadiSam system protein A|nr:AmmeMemoRadiSam system protein A [Bacillota bacterium]
MLKFIGLVPHPPLIIPGVSRSEAERSRVERTIAAMEQLARRIHKAKVERLIVITPHGPLLREGIAAAAPPLLEGDFSRFGAAGVRVFLETDPVLLQHLQRESAEGPLRLIALGAGERSLPRGFSLDHGAAVPLYYLQQAGVRAHGLHLTYTFASYRELYRFGKALRRAVEARGLPAAIVASGDLSHRLIPGAPAGYSPRGAAYDRMLLELLREGRLEDILDLDEDLVEEAGECALRSFVIALGAIPGKDFRTEVLSYEGPFGVGYMVAEIHPLTGGSRNGVAAREEEAAKGSTTQALLARRALHHYLEHGRPPAAPDPLPDELSMQAGAFVSLKKRGKLRGCIGTIEPVRRNLAEEIIANAVSAGIKDPRFAPVRLEEIDELIISVDVLMAPERVESPAELDPRKYGVLVRSGHRSGLLLPDLEGIDTVAEQIAIARRKAGIGPREAIELYRFEVRRYE